MNTPLLLTSVALLAGVAARPIDNDQRGNDLRELIRSPDNDERQAFLGRIPSGFESINSLQLHDIHDNANGVGPDGSTSPRFASTDPSEPDPGLDSPYMGPQQHLASIDQELGSPALISDTTVPSSPPPRKTEQPRLVGGDQDPVHYSRTVVILVFSSLAAIILVGLTVAVVYVAQLLRRMVLREEVWKSVASGRGGGEKGGVDVSEKDQVERHRAGMLEEREGVIAAREVPGGALSRYPPPEPTKPSEASIGDQASVEDPDLSPLPENVPPASVPTVRGQDRDRNMGLALVAWTYDNWVTHFMFAIFGWLGVFFGGTDSR